jgi:hypothetical protein
MDQILSPKLTDLELEALRQIAVHPATRHIPYRVQSRLKDIGYAKEVLGGLVLTDDGYNGLRLIASASALLLRPMPRADSGNAADASFYRGKRILRPGTWQEWDVAARCLLQSRLLRDSAAQLGPRRRESSMSKPGLDGRHRPILDRLLLSEKLSECGLRYQSGGALRALAMYRKSTGRRDRLSIGLGTESMPELGPGTKRRASVMRAPPWSAVLWAAPSRAGPRHSRTGLRSPSRQ